MSYLYSLRLALDPGWTDEAGLADLPQLVRAGRIDDVMVFANVEELNTGHTTLAERAVFRDLAERTGAVAADVGASMSLNPWHTVMHGDYGKRMRAGQDFRPMVDPWGRVAQLSACPLDPRWREYLATLYGDYAAARPRFLWVEDDFRYHNHPPLEWGGCFCAEHVAEFSRRAGRELARGEFVDGMLAPGDPHPFRRIWLETARDGLEAAAAAIEAAVHAVSPATRLGLMTSVPAVHAAEGRRWASLLAALSGPHPAAVRIHLPAYAERRPADYVSMLHSISDAHRALLPPGTEVYPELENFPYSRFAKSLAFTGFQLRSAQVLAPSGMTIDLYDLNGNGPVLEEGYQDVLAAVKDELDEGLAAGVFARPRAGVAVLISEESAAAVHTSGGRSPDELYPREYFFGSLLGAYGIAFRYTTETTLSGEVAAVSGQYFRTVGPEVARRLLERNRMVLDAEAVETLVGMGLGDTLGVASIRWSGDEDGLATYEEAVEGVTLLRRPRARASTLLLGGDLGLIEYDPARVRALTRFQGAAHADAGPAHVVVDDRVLVVPFGRFNPLEPLPPMVRTTMRQQLIQQVLCGWDDSLVLLRGAADVAVYAYPVPGGIALYLVNASLDPLAGPRVRIGAREVCDIQHGGRSVPFTRDGEDIVLDLPLAPLDCTLLLVRCGREAGAQM